MTAHAERKVVVVQHADVLAIEYYDVLDGDEREGETKPKAYIPWLTSD